MPAPVPIPVTTRRLVKPKRHRTRLGCLWCKRRKIKCDESKPSCSLCHDKGLTCSYAVKGTRVASPENNHTRQITSHFASASLFDVDSPLPTTQVYPSGQLDIASRSVGFHQDVENIQEDEELLVNAFCEQMTRNVIRSVDTPGSPHLNIFKHLLHESQAVLHAIRALTTLDISAHEACHERAARARTVSLKHQGKAIELLKRDLQNAKLVHSDAVLAATLLLFLFEQAYDADNDNHLSYFCIARKLIQQRFLTVNDIVVYEHEVTWATRILVKTFVWNNVMMIVTKPFLLQSTDVDILRLTDMLNKKSEQNLYLLGWAKDMFWLMTDLATFTQSLLAGVPHNKDDESWRINMLPKAIGVEKRLKAYTPTLESVKYYMGNVEVSEETTGFCLATIELLRQTSLLYLYQVMPDLMPTFLVDDLAHNLLLQLELIPKDCSMIAYHGWILLTIGAQCLDPQCRALLLERLKLSHDRYRFAAIATNATKLILEVWARRDAQRKAGTYTSRIGIGHWTDVLKDIGQNWAYV